MNKWLMLVLLLLILATSFGCSASETSNMGDQPITATPGTKSRTVKSSSASVPVQSPSLSPSSSPSAHP